MRVSYLKILKCDCTSYVFSPVACVTLAGEIQGRWVFAADVARRGGERYETHWVCHIATYSFVLFSFFSSLVCAQPFPIWTFSGVSIAYPAFVWGFLLSYTYVVFGSFHILPVGMFSTDRYLFWSFFPFFAHFILSIVGRKRARICDRIGIRGGHFQISQHS